MTHTAARSYLDVCLDVAKVMGPQGVGLGLLCELEITQRGKLKGQVLQCVGGLVHNQN